MNFGRIAVTMLATGTALTLGLGTARLAFAQSAPSYTVNTYVQTDALDNQLYEMDTPVGGTESYGSNYSISVPNIPVGPMQTILPGDTSTYSPVPTMLSLTSVTLNIASTNNDVFLGGGGTVTAASSAYANLATGSLGVSGSSTGVVDKGMTGFGGISTSWAVLEDTLTFSDTSGTSLDGLEIGVQWSVSGGVSSSAGGEGSMEASLYFGGTTGIATASTGWTSDNGTLTNNFPTGVDNQWVTSDVESNTDNSVVIDGTYALEGMEDTVPVELILECSSSSDGGTGSCEYYDTESISFTNIPSGVTYTSASGVFLTQPLVSTVPEPGSPLLFGTALLALGWTVRRSRWLRPSHRAGGPLTL